MRSMMKLWDFGWIGMKDFTFENGLGVVVTGLVLVCVRFLGLIIFGLF